MMFDIQRSLLSVQCSMPNARCPMFDVNFHEYFSVKIEIRFASCITIIMHFMEIPLTKLIAVSSALSLFLVNVALFEMVMMMKVKKNEHSAFRHFVRSTGLETKGKTTLAKRTAKNGESM